MESHTLALAARWFNVHGIPPYPSRNMHTKFNFSSVNSTCLSYSIVYNFVQHSVIIQRRTL